jgi:hypothetical protein
MSCEPKRGIDKVKSLRRAEKTGVLKGQKINREERERNKDRQE